MVPLKPRPPEPELRTATTMLVSAVGLAVGFYLGLMINLVIHTFCKVVN